MGVCECGNELKIGFHKNVDNFLITSEPPSFSGRTVLHEVSYVFCGPTAQFRP